MKIYAFRYYKEKVKNIRYKLALINNNRKDKYTCY